MGFEAVSILVIVLGGGASLFLWLLLRSSKEGAVTEEKLDQSEAIVKDVKEKADNAEKILNQPDKSPSDLAAAFKRLRKND